LTDDEIETMVKDAESHAREDKERREKAEARNNLDNLIYRVEKDLKEWGDKLEGSTKEGLEGALEEARKALKSDDAAQIRAAGDALNQAFAAAGSKIYEAQTAAGATDQPAPGGAGEAAPSKDEDVVEADYEIVEEDKGS
jgi:molecular chaperone DnaK